MFVALEPVTWQLPGQGERDLSFRHQAHKGDAPHD
jgi:hypothetical protein